MLLEHPQSPPRAIAPALHSPIVELRQYTLHPGRRDTLIELFEREFLDTQAQTGISVLGQFRDLDAADRFVWLRGFEDMERRRISLERFYGGPAWQAHRDVANATMIDSDDVLLLRPVAPASAFVLDDAFGDLRDGGVIVATLYSFDAPVDLDFLDFFAAELHPAFAAAGGPAIASFSTEYAPNTFPRLPVREGEHVFTWFARFPDVGAHAAYREKLVSSTGWRALAVALGRRLQGPPQVLRLAPTARSRLR